MSSPAPVTVDTSIPAIEVLTVDTLYPYIPLPLVLELFRIIDIGKYEDVYTVSLDRNNVFTFRSSCYSAVTSLLACIAPLVLEPPILFTDNYATSPTRINGEYGFTVELYTFLQGTLSAYDIVRLSRNQHPPVLVRVCRADPSHSYVEGSAGVMWVKNNNGSVVMEGSINAGIVKVVRDVLQNSCPVGTDPVYMFSVQPTSYDTRSTLDRLKGLPSEYPSGYSSELEFLLPTHAAATALAAYFEQTLSPESVKVDTLPVKDDVYHPTLCFGRHRVTLRCGMKEKYTLIDNVPRYGVVVYTVMSVTLKNAANAVMSEIKPPNNRMDYVASMFSDVPYVSKGKRHTLRRAVQVLMHSSVVEDRMGDFSVAVGGGHKVMPPLHAASACLHYMLDTVRVPYYQELKEGLLSDLLVQTAARFLDATPGSSVLSCLPTMENGIQNYVPTSDPVLSRQWIHRVKDCAAVTHGRVAVNSSGIEFTESDPRAFFERFSEYPPYVLEVVKSLMASTGSSTIDYNFHDDCFVLEIHPFQLKDIVDILDYAKYDGRTVRYDVKAENENVTVTLYMSRTWVHRKRTEPLFPRQGVRLIRMHQDVELFLRCVNTIQMELGVPHILDLLPTTDLGSIDYFKPPTRHERDALICDNGWQTVLGNNQLLLMLDDKTRSTLFHMCIMSMAECMSKDYEATVYTYYHIKEELASIVWRELPHLPDGRVPASIEDQSHLLAYTSKRMFPYIRGFIDPSDTPPGIQYDYIQ